MMDEWVAMMHLSAWLCLSFINASGCALPTGVDGKFYKGDKRIAVQFHCVLLFGQFCSVANVNDRETLFMDDLNRSYAYIDHFPSNLVSPGIYSYRLKEYEDRLDRNANRLFCSEANAAVDFLQIIDEVQKGKSPNPFWSTFESTMITDRTQSFRT
jgi:hypothetical protein